MYCFQTNVNDWLNGYGDLPSNLTKFALSLPHWKDGEVPPASFVQMYAFTILSEKQTV